MRLFTTDPHTKLNHSTYEWISSVILVESKHYFFTYDFFVSSLLSSVIEDEINVRYSLLLSVIEDEITV